MAHGPCKNPNCNSHGKPHPNCKCYDGYADGGEVKPYCSDSNPHKNDCEYYLSESGAGLHRMAAYDAVSSYLAHEGFHGVLNMRSHAPEHAMKKYDRSVKRGGDKIHGHMEELFGGPASDKVDTDKATEALHEWISKGGHTHDLQEELYKQGDTENFADGGEVKKQHKGKGIHGHPMEQEYPEQNIMLNAAKGRASLYLQSLKPQPHQAKLAFDAEPDQTAQKKSYQKALKIAAHPLSIVKNIKDGTIEPAQIKHLQALHPEVVEALQNKLTQKIIDLQMKGDRPNYKVRQGLSLLFGTALSGEMSPANIQAAQAVFQKVSSQTQTAPGNAQPGKKLSAVDKSAQSYLLPEDAAASRQQKQ